MTFHVSPENEKFLRTAVERGDFDDPSAVVNEALRVLQERERRVVRLRELIQEGIDSGPAIPGDAVFAELQEHARRLAHPDTKNR